MAIERAEVERIAELARLAIPPERIERVAAELSEVLEFVAALSRLDLAGCEPTVFAPRDGVLREDSIEDEGVTTAQALASAPAREDDFFLVPPVVENLNP